MNCPKCNELMEQMEDEPDVNFVGGWFCEACDVWIDHSEVNNAPEVDR